MSWSWEYLPSEEHVTGSAPAGFLAAVALKAAELVRVAEALYLDGTTTGAAASRCATSMSPVACSRTTSSRAWSSWLSAR